MNSTTKKIGLALSGGGFRASLYHLGVARFLRDAGLLSQVTHITAVSGGSIFGAHLVLNWARYNGSAGDFEAAAGEFLTFVRLDVRNRIFRRFPLMLLVRWARWLLGRSNRKLTRTGLLEREYQNNLFGDVSLFELPKTPEIHFLATNVSEGCLCSFNRNGLLMVHRRADDSLYLNHVHVGLATVAMAVTASSAFPGFFPPLELTGADVGANSGEFGRQAYTDGGVFDNLGVRMFRCLELLLPEDKRLALDGVLVSDVGKRFEVHGQQRRAGGVIRTALRASDIVMDRVWQLETETFKGTPGFVFAPMTGVVDRAEDPTALHPEIQRQAANIRTDLDRFSDLEISSLVQHGYSVARKACRGRPDLFGADLPKDVPWDPIPAPPSPDLARSSTKGPLWQTVFAFLSKVLERGREPAEATVKARTLQASAVRRIWRTLLDYRDWTSYVYVPIIVPILVLTPYFAYKVYEHSQTMDEIINSLAMNSPDLERMSELLNGPIKPWTGAQAEEIGEMDNPDLKGFQILQDSHILDLRKWTPTNASKTSPEHFLYGFRRLKVWRLKKETGNNLFRLPLLPTSPLTQVRFPAQELQPRLLFHREENEAAAEKRRWEMVVDCARVAPGDLVEILEEHLSPGDFVHDHGTFATLQFEPEAETAELTRWILMPEGREYKRHRLVRYETGKPETMEPFKFATEYLQKNYKILAFKLLALKPGFTYELTWYYK
jgi:predicted acylesterase/phospholipase RssA